MIRPAPLPKGCRKQTALQHKAAPEPWVPASTTHGKIFAADSGVAQTGLVLEMPLFLGSGSCGDVPILPSAPTPLHGAAGVGVQE